MKNDEWVWHSVKDCLPPEEWSCLVLNEHISRWMWWPALFEYPYKIFVLDSCSIGINHQYANRIPLDVTHWMPSPHLLKELQ